MVKRTKNVYDLLLLGYQKEVIHDNGKLSDPSGEGRETADWLFAWNCSKQHNTVSSCTRKLDQLLKRAQNEQKSKLAKKYHLERYYSNLIHELEDYKKKPKVYMR